MNVRRCACYHLSFNFNYTSDNEQPDHKLLKTCPCLFTCSFAYKLVSYSRNYFLFLSKLLPLTDSFSISGSFITSNSLHLSVSSCGWFEYLNSHYTEFYGSFKFSLKFSSHYYTYIRNYMYKYNT